MISIIKGVASAYVCHDTHIWDNWILENQQAQE